MKKKVFILLVLTVIIRIIILISAKTDVLFFLSPRNFNGRGLLVSPVFLDFLIPALTFFLISKRKINFTFKFNNLKKVSLIALVVIIPVLIGLILSKYEEESFFITDFTLNNFVRWLLFILTFISVQLFADNVKLKKKFYRYFTIFIYILFAALTQDILVKAGTVYTIFGFISSVGLSTGLLAIASRKYYKKYPTETILSASVLGVFIIFFIYAAQSVSYFTILLPALAFYSSAFGIYFYRKKILKLIFLTAPLFLALILNFTIPYLLPENLVKQFTENNISSKMYQNKTGNITVKYPDKNLKDIAIKFATVINAANKISKETFGFSPKVDEITILGIAPGGFHGKFPNQIVGNIISEKYIKNCNDSTFLNSDIPADFPDPVNAILHEYSHLYGCIPYYKWMPGSEEEGWATFSATKLSQLLYKKYGNKLWKPAYDYRRQAEKITQLNLSGRAVVWSHPNEYGGFKLWYSLDNKFGTKKLYQKRRRLTYRNINPSIVIESNPQKAKKLVKGFGIKNFIPFSDLKLARLGDKYTLKDYLTLSSLAGANEKHIRKIYAIMKNIIINPSVILPEY